jgi:hypothetical protein
VPSLLTRPAAKYVTMKVFIFYIVVFEINSSRSPPKKLSFFILLPSTNQVTGPGLLGLTGRRVVQALTKSPPGPDHCDHWVLTCRVQLTS